MDPAASFQEHSPFFKLPKEIRLVIYELVIQYFNQYKQVKVGGRDFNSKVLSPWPKQPPITLVCRLTRAESLKMYYSTAVFVLNIQRPSGEDMVVSWINRLGASCPEAFNKIQNVSVITGLGNWEPPKEYMIDIQRGILAFATRPCAPAYLYTRRSNMRLWTRLVCGALKKRLKELPSKESPEFSVARSLREVIAVVGELSGYGIYDDFPSIVGSGESSVTDCASERESMNSRSLLTLPKELRLAIYEHALTSTTPVTIGQRAISLRDLTDWPTYPGLTRTSSLVRKESLPIYFACTHFILNIQRTQCEEIVLDWINRCSAKHPEAFRDIQHVSVVAGSGIRQPPRQYEFYIQQSRLLSTIDRPILQPYTLPANRWSPPPWEQLRLRIVQMPKRGDGGFDVAQNLREIVDVLARYSD